MAFTSKNPKAFKQTCIVSNDVTYNLANLRQSLYCSVCHKYLLVDGADSHADRTLIAKNYREKLSIKIKAINVIIYKKYSFIIYNVHDTPFVKQ